MQVKGVFMNESKPNHETACRDPQRAMARLLYEHMAAGRTFDHRPRQNERVNLSLVIMVTPVVDGRVHVEDAFFTITKDISLRGLAFVVNQPMTATEVLIEIRLPSSDETIQVRGQIRHQADLGAGFRHVGVELVEPLGSIPAGE
jgi:hypothetical protein